MTCNPITPRTVERARAVPASSRLRHRSAGRESGWAGALPSGISLGTSDIYVQYGGKSAISVGPNVPVVADTVTWSISQLTEWVNALIGETLGGEIWIEGEISNLQRSAAGHVYFTLTEPAAELSGQRRATNTLAVSLFEWHRQNVNRHLRRSGGAVRISDGVRVRVRGSVEIYGARSQLQLKMTGIDPVFTLGTMAAERARTLATLEAEGLLAANRALRLPPVPTRVAVVTSRGSAAHADALHELVGSGIGLDIIVIDARVQGTDAVASIVAALSHAASLSPDVVLLVRGGGARTDLSAFDDVNFAHSVALTPVPVWTGIGHETDRTVADEVAHQSFKTPTACAAAVADAATAAAQWFDVTWEEVCDAAAVRLERANARLDRLASRSARSALADLDAGGAHLTNAAHRTRRAVDAHLIRQAAHLRDLVRRVTLSAPRSVADHSRRLDSIASTLRAYDPATSLARGWTITRGVGGRVVRAADLTPGDIVVTQFHDGSVASQVQRVDGRGATVTGP